jgi:hypothetical protein
MPLNLPESQLERTENLLGARFPDSYRLAMMRENGGVLDVADETWELIPLRDASSQRRLSETSDDVLSWNKQFRMWKRWHTLAIAIARNGLGDALVLIREDGLVRPEVHAWRHETGTLEAVAEDFGDLPSAAANTSDA